MDEIDMAAAIAFELNKGAWKAEADGDEITFTNEDDETFLLVVSAADDD